MNKSANSQAHQDPHSKDMPQRETYKISIYLAEVFAVLVFLMFVSLIANHVIFSQAGL